MHAKKEIGDNFDFFKEFESFLKHFKNLTPKPKKKSEITPLLHNDDTFDMTK